MTTKTYNPQAVTFTFGGITYVFDAEPTFLRLQLPTDRLERWRDFGNTVKIDGPIPITFEFHEFGTVGQISCWVRASIRLVDGGTASEISKRQEVFGEPDINQLRALAREVYLHELDEWISVGGCRMFDPHKTMEQL